MINHNILYLCSACFAANDSEARHHGRLMIRCDVGAPGDERRKPAMDTTGRLTSHAPRWFLEVAGRTRSDFPTGTRREPVTMGSTH